MKRVSGVLVGPALVLIYRFSLYGGRLVTDEFKSIAGEDSAMACQPIFIFGAWIAFGYLAKLFFGLLASGKK